MYNVQCIVVCSPPVVNTTGYYKSQLPGTVPSDGIQILAAVHLEICFPYKIFERHASAYICIYLPCPLATYIERTFYLRHISPLVLALA